MLDKQLRIAASAFMGFQTDRIKFYTDIVMNGPAIDLDNTVLGYENTGADLTTLGLTFSVDGDLFDWLSLSFRGEVIHCYETESLKAYRREPLYRFSLGGIYRFGFGGVFNLSMVFVGSTEGSIGDPISALNPTIDVKTHRKQYLLGGFHYPIEFERFRLELGVSLFNPFGSKFFDTEHIFTADGTHFGGQQLGTRTMFTARLIY